uniref:MACPF domain-containing protein n=1 Tax=Arundo donax TaxID=35708 RepID=A0A0A9CHQ6_ARUDO
MSELFNHKNSLTGKIPSGLFNSCFDLDCSSWAEDASATKCLAFDGYFISLLDLRLDCRPLALADHVVRDLPAAWDPSAIARYGHGMSTPATIRSSFFLPPPVQFTFHRRC